ncbi:phospholipid transport system transporter-binding protein [Gammaproteobacteria bacterium]
MSLSAQITSLENGHYQISGELVFSTVSEVLENSQEIFSGPKEVYVDFSKVARCDSAALALLLAWIRNAKSQKKSIHYLGIPASLLAIARMSGVEQLLAKF